MATNGTSAASFHELFKHRPRYRPDALEAVEMLPAPVDQQEVRKVLARALKDQQTQDRHLRLLKHDLPAFRRELKTALRAMTVVLGRFDPNYTPKCIHETIDELSGMLGRLGHRQPAGRKRMDPYRRGLQHLRSLGVNRALATSMLRAIVPIPGPPPAG